MTDTQNSTELIEDVQLTQEEILALNSRAIKVDSFIAGFIILLAAIFGGYYVANYTPPVSGAMKASVVLDAQNFVADNDFAGAEIRQDPETGSLIAEVDGEVIDTYTPTYGGVKLNVSTYSNGEPRYDVAFDESQLK
jgi:hypothetical protein